MTNEATKDAQPSVNESSTVTTQLVPRFREAFERRAAEIRAVPDTELLAITLDIPKVVATILGAWSEIQELRPEIQRHLPTFDLAIFDSLESCALALGHAQTEYQTATDPPPSLVALAEQATKTREVLLGEVKLLILRDAIDGRAIHELRGTTGYKNVAFDIFALSNVLKKNWSKVSDRTGLEREELDAAENLADNLVTSAGKREQAPAVTTEAVRDRQAAFTLCVNTYEDVRAAIAYVRRRQGDADSIAPSLYVGRNAARKGSKDEGADPTLSGAAPAVPSSPAVASNTMTATTKPDISGTGPFVQ